MPVPRKTWRIVSAAAIAVALAQTALAQNDSPPVTKLPEPKANYSNHADCVKCHFRDQPDKDDVSFAQDFVQVAEANIWLEKDKHQQAFTLLIKEENRALVRRMLGDFEISDVVQICAVAPDQLNPLQRERRKRLKECLHCHSAWPHDAETPPVNLDLGVTCQACHGPGDAWEKPHKDQRNTVWRLLSPAEKSRHHMTDVRSPITRAKVCASCHIGDIKQGRFVTHEMYANGHPPLPSLEPESFAAQMPPHWRTLTQKLAPIPFRMWNGSPGEFDAQRKAWLDNYGTRFDAATKSLIKISEDEIKLSYRQANFPSEHDPITDLVHTRGVIVSSLVLMQSYAQLLGDAAAEQLDGQHPWPEFAVHDCTACHHELRTGPQLTGRPFRPGPPGRPPMSLWPTALVRMALLHSSADRPTAAATVAAFDEKLRRLESAVVARPFGDPKRIQADATDLANWLDVQAQRVADSPFDVAAARQALRALTDPKQNEIRDYHSARQLAWAIRQIAAELAQNGVAFEPNKLFRGPNDEDPLSLDLPAGQTKSVIGSLASSLDAIAHYDPAWFAAELSRIHAALDVP